jgi:hypothetical protein
VQKKTPTPRRRGAQPGNKNALRHGFYSALFTGEEKAALDVITERDLESEIVMARVAARQMFKLFKTETVPSLKAQLFDLLTSANVKLATLLRTQKLLRGEGASAADLLIQAIAEIGGGPASLS